MKKSVSDPFLSELARGALARRTSRRRFMEGALAAGLSVPAASLLWSRQVEAATPKRGGTFRAGVHDGGTTDTLDPGTAAATYTIQLNYACRSYLTEITPTNELGPDAAESWESSPDAKEWRFKLVRGMEFHNGKTVTPKDVIASLNHHRGENSTSGAKGLLLDVEDIVADGDDTVVIKLKIGSADMPFLVTDYHLPIMPADGEGNVDWKSGIGAGAYKIESFQPGVTTEMTRHPNYHRADQAFFDAVQLLSLNDPNARQTALVSNVVDAVSEADIKTVAMLARTPGIEIDETPGGTHGGMPMNCRVAPFDNPDLRLALKYAIDREEIVQKILLGHGIVANDHPIAPVMPYAAKLEQRPYDPEKAKFHLQKSGLSNVSISLSAGDAAFPGSVEMGLLFRETLSRIGVNLEVVREATDGYWSNVWMKKPFVVVHTGQRPTPDIVFSLFYRRGAPWNDTGWDNDRFQTLLVEAKAELDQAKRADMYREMQQLLSDEGGTIVPFFRNKLYARRSNVKHGPNISSAWELDGGKAYQRWWFE